MTLPWIKARTGLSRDPAVIYMARTLGITRHEVVGRLLEVWGWADGETEDGVLYGVDAQFIDDIAGLAGFARAMAATPGTPWLMLPEQPPLRAVIPEWWRHNGSSAKRRARNQLQQADSRERRGKGRSGHKSAVSDVSPRRQPARLTRGEERVQLSPSSPPTLGSAPDAPPCPQCSRSVWTHALPEADVTRRCEAHGRPLEGTLHVTCGSCGYVRSRTPASRPCLLCFAGDAPLLRPVEQGTFVPSNQGATP